MSVDSPAARGYHCRPRMTRSATSDVEDRELSLFVLVWIHSVYLPARPQGQFGACAVPCRYAPVAPSSPWTTVRPLLASPARSAFLRVGMFQHAGQTPTVASRPVVPLLTRTKARPSWTALVLAVIAVSSFNLISVHPENKQAPRHVDTARALIYNDASQREEASEGPFHGHPAHRRAAPGQLLRRRGQLGAAPARLHVLHLRGRPARGDHPLRAGGDAAPGSWSWPPRCTPAASTWKRPRSSCSPRCPGTRTSRGSSTPSRRWASWSA